MEREGLLPATQRRDTSLSWVWGRDQKREGGRQEGRSTLWIPPEVQGSEAPLYPGTLGGGGVLGAPDQQGGLRALEVAGRVSTQRGGLAPVNCAWFSPSPSRTSDGRGWARNADIGKPREQKGQATSAGEAVKTKTGLLACHHSILQTPHCTRAAPWEGSREGRASEETPQP